MIDRLCEGICMMDTGEVLRKVIDCLVEHISW